MTTGQGASQATWAVDSLPVLILYPHSRCNCRCVMCDIWKTESTQEISAAELERHGDDIARCASNGWSFQAANR